MTLCLIVRICHLISREEHKFRVLEKKVIRIVVGQISVKYTGNLGFYMPINLVELCWSTIAVTYLLTYLLTYGAEPF
jgi:hypothetical protein